MTDADRVIAGLMHALELIQRECTGSRGSLSYITGVVAEASQQCDAQRIRNSDGYLVMPSHKLTPTGDAHRHNLVASRINLRRD